MSIKIYVKYVKNNRDFYTTKMNLPTGNLDEKTRKIVENIFDDLNKKAGKTILLVTHDLEFAQKAKRRYALKEGRLRK